ncbi:MAG: mechanosensitive ion channel protein MscS [Sandaracinus sp.]|nr:mechanosensitive ion channel protein MscS [Myxococcales bacterium]MAT25372.1 mechanosensitive ion channel protein MscS [Sandaracinus sp.]HJK89574.1 mechanosensitive ion channel [Polyangiaceae bacterium LLY-WYZ-15_(1-7)]MBJ74863.1 mechanosensitive ion channel protein MscS [Sandaracinus sp.]HJL31858.1 mechanosensitive ion channel [Polyangiaceae bacterium LLY-WYZ-15_(1-7)]
MTRVALAFALALGFALPPAPAHADPLTGLPEVEGAIPRRTPREAMTTYLESCRAGRWIEAAHVLDLRRVPEERRAEVGPLRARRLKAVLDQELWVELDRLPDTPDGALEEGETEVHVGDVRLEGQRVPILLRRARLGGGERVWLLAPETVARIPELHEALGPAFVEALPAFFSTWRLGEIVLWQWLGLILFAFLAYLFGVVVAGLVLRVSERLSDKTRAHWDDHLVKTLRGPARIVLGLVAFLGSVELLHLAAPAHAAIRRLLLLGFIASLAWLATRFVRFVAHIVQERAIERAEAVDDAPKVRAIRTQVRLLQRIVNIILGVLAAALMLMQFEVVRSVGMSLLASAGIAGVVLGLAAQKSIAGLLAGIQLSITQPIRIGDTVIVEGEWGTIEEINLTYVVLKVWDQRRLVVPIATFLEKPFQNWTRTTTELLGTVYFYADYRLPIDAVREELDRILEGNPKWDERVKNVLVTEVTDRAVQVRALVSARNASDHWDLRCEVREKLVAWLRAHEGGRYLPRMRVEGEEEEGVAGA